MIDENFLACLSGTKFGHYTPGPRTCCGGRAGRYANSIAVDGESFCRSGSAAAYRCSIDLPVDSARSTARRREHGAQSVFIEVRSDDAVVTLRKGLARRLSGEGCAPGRPLGVRDPPHLIAGVVRRV